jgi:hypothetical protein
MSHTYGFTSPCLISWCASGYNKDNYGYAKCTYLSMIQPEGAGVLRSMVDDQALWDAPLYIERLVEPESPALAWMPNTLKDGTSTHYR